MTASSKGISRRTFLETTAGLAAGGLLLEACTSTSSTSNPSGTKSSPAGSLVPPLTMAHYSSDYSAIIPAMARVLAEDYQKLGLTINLKPMNFETFVSQITVGQALKDIAVVGWGGDPYRIDPNHWVVDLCTCGSSRNPSKWCDHKYDKIAFEQQRTTDIEKRRKLVYQAQEYFESKLPWWPIVHEKGVILYNKSKWRNVTSPAPLQPHETVVKPWLDITPTTGDRTLNWVHPGALSTWNILSEPASQGYLRWVYDTYTKIENGQATPWAAEKVTLVDPKTYELTLRQGMSFHDGTPVTPEDAAFSVNYLLKWNPPTYAVALSSVKGAEATGRRTFRIHMKAPNPSFPVTGLTYLVILPKHIWQDIPKSVHLKDAGDWDPVKAGAVIGSGPFKFVSWKRNQESVLDVNKQHWRAPSYDRLIRQIPGSVGAMKQAMQSGDGDINTQGIPQADAAKMASDQDSLGQLTFQMLTTYELSVNTTQPPFDQLVFRKALRMATDKQKVVDQVYFGFAETGGEAQVPRPATRWYDKDLRKIPFDIDRARKMLQDAGYGWDSQGRLQYPKRK